MKLIMSLLSLIGLFSCGSASYENLKAVEFAKAIADGSVALVDVRTPEEYAAGHLPGAGVFMISTTNTREKT